MVIVLEDYIFIVNKNATVMHVFVSEIQLLRGFYKTYITSIVLIRLNVALKCGLYLVR